MIWIWKQRVLQHFISALLVIGVFATKNASTTAKFDASDNLIALDGGYNHFDNDESPEHSVFYEAVKLSKSLATRNHTKIASVYDALMTEDQLTGEIDDLHRNRVKYVERIRDEYKHSLDDRQQTTKQYSASNTVTVNSVFDHSLGNDENSDDQLNAQIIRHHLNAPMKVIQSLLSLALDARGKAQQSLRHIIEQLTYKPRVVKEALIDLDFLLRQESAPLATLKQAILELIRRVDEQILAGGRVPTVRLINDVSNKWGQLRDVIETEKSQNVASKRIVELLDRMLGLTKCFELGTSAYRQCRNSPTKLAAINAHVDKFQDELQKWKKIEQIIYRLVVPLLKEIEKSSGEAGVHPLILSVLPSFSIVLVQIQRNSLYSNDLKRVVENTKQLNRMTMNLWNFNQTYSDRATLMKAIQHIQAIDHDIPAELNALNREITANLMLELCQIAREVLKLRVFPFHQDYLELCDMPAIADPSKADEHVRHHLLQNIAKLKAKIDVEKPEKSYPTDTVSEAFDEWKSNEFRKEITKLLKGEKIILNTFDRYSHRNALKFRQILLDFNFANKTRQNEFYDAINGYAVNVKLIGNNNLRCDKAYFFVPTDVNLHFQYFVGHGNSAAAGNGLYEEVLKRNPPHLSVHSTWEFQLDNPNTEPGRPQDFIDDEIDLQFKGAFKYVFNKNITLANVCDNIELYKNYRLDTEL